MATLEQLKYGDRRTDIYFGDCLEMMKLIPDKSVDFILCDLPYGTTQCKWDIVIPFKPLWKQYKRVMKPRGAIALFGNEPFSSHLRLSNLKWFKYDWVWVKNTINNQLNAKHQPLRKFELISIFYARSRYYPQGLVEVNKMSGTGNNLEGKSAETTGEVKGKKYFQKYGNYPTNVIYFDTAVNTKHPTQKPVDLCEYMIRTYTKEDMIVLDNTMGSGTTGVACINTGRKFIGIESKKEYYDYAQERIHEALERKFNGN